VEDEVENEVPDEVEAPESEVVELYAPLDIEVGKLDRLVGDESVDVTEATTEAAA